jgi:ABC-type transport system involved in multi-copper enzyme maturation permease subunit
VISLLPAEIRRQTGRKGSFFGSLVWTGLFGAGVLIWALVSASATGAGAVDQATGLLVFAIVLASIVVGATAGAYDVDQGIMRYLVMTGRPRWQLVLVRLPGLIVTVVLITVPALLMVLLGSAVAGGPHATGGAYFDLFYQTWMTGFLYGALSLAIGMFMKSNGIAIAAAVVLNFAGLLIAGAIAEYVSKDLGHAFYPVVAGVVIARDGGGDAFSVGISAVLVAVWLAALIGAAIARIQRTEY